jgi:hypothetical protein
MPILALSNKALVGSDDCVVLTFGYQIQQEMTCKTPEFSGIFSSLKVVPTRLTFDQVH